MVKKFKVIYKNLFSLIVITIIGFLLGYFITSYAINDNFAYYQIEVKSDNDINQLLNYEYFNNTIKKIDDYNDNLSEGQKKISYANIDYDAMLKSIKCSNDNDIYKISIKYKYFPTTIRTSSGELNYGYNRCHTYIKLIFSYSGYDIEYINNPADSINNYINPYIVSAIASGIIFISYIVFILIASKSTKEIEEIYDNKYLFKTPFNKKYWNLAANAFSNVKNLSVISILFALMIICKLITLPSGFGALGISFTYLVFSVISMIYGPMCGVIIGMMSDLLGYFLFQSGTTFFLGYTLSAMLSGFTYGIFFYRTKITFTKCLYARIVVNLFVNVFLGSIWWAIINDLQIDAFYSYLFVISLPKNLLYLLPQSILLYLVLKYLSKPMSAFGLIDGRISDNCSLL